MKLRIGSFAGLLAVSVFALAGNGVAAAAETSAASTHGSITNASSGISIGVVHQYDGSYGHGTYDVLLKPGHDTFHDFGWQSAGGFYIGPGYCAQLWYINVETGKWERGGPDTGPGLEQLSDNATWKVVAYRGNCRPVS